MSDRFIKILAIGTVICIVSTVFFSDMTPKYTSVSAITDENGKTIEESATADPFGYFNGEWNLWEFIGDSFSSLLP